MSNRYRPFPFGHHSRLRGGFAVLRDSGDVTVARTPIVVFPSSLALNIKGLPHIQGSDAVSRERCFPFRESFLHRRLRSGGILVGRLLDLIGFGSLRYDDDDGEGFGHLIALQDVVAVCFWQEDDVLVADGRGDLHLGAFCGLHRELQILAEGRNQLVAVAVISAFVSDRRVDELELDLDIGCRRLLLDGGVLLLLGGSGDCHLLRRLLSLGLFRRGLGLVDILHRVDDLSAVSLGGGVGARVVREHGHVQEREHQKHRQQD